MWRNCLCDFEYPLQLSNTCANFFKILPSFCLFPRHPQATAVPVYNSNPSRTRHFRAYPSPLFAWFARPVACFGLAWSKELLWSTVSTLPAGRANLIHFSTVSSAHTLYMYSSSSPVHIYASPSSGEAYRDRQLTTNFEVWVEIFCVPTCFHVRIPKPCLSVCPSVCPYPEKRNLHSFVNISPTLVIDASMERSSRVLQHGNQNLIFF